MNLDLVASRYSKGVFDACRGDVRTLTRVAREFNQFENIWDKGINELFCNPAFKRAERLRVLNAFFNDHNFLDITRSFLLLLEERSRVLLFPEIVKNFKELLNDLVDRVVVTIISPQEVEGELLTEYRMKIQGELGHSALIKQIKDPDLIGGIKILVRNRMFDGSIEGQLQRLGDTLGMPRSA
ncbi:MAG: ATP synthase F1 subunit delta [Deltaproteobacteria bacterium]|nr:ATP synthase F1 subunit delta [Deltaproteobacteria bacterium]